MMMASKRESTPSSSASLPSKMQKINTEDHHSASRCYPAGTCFILAPAYIRNKGCIVNVRNSNDHLCFIYSILACMKYHIIDGKRERASTYKHFLDIFNYDTQEMPMKIVNIPHFEQCNLHVSINVIKYTPPLKFKRIKIIEESIKHPYFELVYRSMHQSEGGCQIIYLLLVENNENHYRYMAITNLKRMLIVAKGTKYYDNVCFSCLRLFRSKSTLEEHNSMCAISKDI